MKMKEIVLPQILSTGIYNSENTAKKSVFSKKRVLTMFEIEIPITDGGISFIEDKQAQITPNLIICAKPNQIRNTKFPFKCYYVHFRVNEGLLYDILTQIPDFTITQNPQKYIAIFNRLHRHGLMANENDAVILQSLVLELIYALSKETHINNTIVIKNDYLYDPITTSIEYIKDNYKEKIELETIANVVSLSPTYFHRLFKSAIGKTFHNYVEEFRIKKAIDLLSLTNKNITEIALECGFSSQSYFNQVFKRRMGKTPREYMKDKHKIYNE